MNQTIVSNGKTGLLSSKLVKIIKFDPREHPHYCTRCGISENNTAISQRGYCKYCSMQIDMEYYNLYVY